MEKKEIKNLYKDREETGKDLQPQQQQQQLVVMDQQQQQQPQQPQKVMEDIMEDI